jgi:hypothetical protein
MIETSPNLNEPLSDKESTTSPSTALTKPKKKSRLTPWQPGQSGNPAGRPVGTKNRITQQKIGIEAALRDQLHQYMPEVLGQAIEMAIGGDRAMIKLLLEMTMSKAVAVEDISEGKDKVQVTIRRLNIEQATVSPSNEPNIINVTPIEVKNVEE